MSTADSPDEPMDDVDDAPARRGLRWPMSAANTVLFSVCIIVAIACFATGQLYAGGVVLLATLFAGAGAVFARRGRAGDLERVNALEYADERDRVAATKGLAVVGVVALILGAAQLAIHVIVDTDGLSRTISLVTFLALTVCWFIANWYFVRRG